MLLRKGGHSRFPWLNGSIIWAAALILLAIALRAILAAKGWPLLDSDEGTMGLMGMHIAFRGERPIFFYAQGYMGATEAYLAAIMFRLFGVSSFTLPLG
jgi:predicted membrane-bound mannosyltransferase